TAIAELTGHRVVCSTKSRSSIHQRSPPFSQLIVVHPGSRWSAGGPPAGAPSTRRRRPVAGGPAAEPAALRQADRPAEHRAAKRRAECERRNESAPPIRTDPTAR